MTLLVPTVRHNFRLTHLGCIPWLVLPKREAGPIHRVGRASGRCRPRRRQNAPWPCCRRQRLLREGNTAGAVDVVVPDRLHRAFSFWSPCPCKGPCESVKTSRTTDKSGDSKQSCERSYKTAKQAEATFESIAGTEIFDNIHLTSVDDAQPILFKRRQVMCMYGMV